MPRFIETVHHGSNATLIAQVATLYLPDQALVADVTYGKGVFWRKVDTARFTLLASDLCTCPERPYDFRALPYAAGSLDVLVLDPPYMHNAGVMRYDHQYQIGPTVAGLTHDGLVALYTAGMAEALRVLKPSGAQLWVKCKDEVASGRQRWSHLEVYEQARGLGFAARDLFILVAASPLLAARWQHQHHARKTHSYLWVFTVGRPPRPGRPEARPRCAYCQAPFTAQRRSGKYCRPAHRVAAFRTRQLTPRPPVSGTVSVTTGDTLPLFPAEVPGQG